MELVWVAEGVVPHHTQRTHVHPGFYLGRHPVTVAQYRAFVHSTGRRVPRSFLDPRLCHDDLPVTQVTWRDASEFAAWVTVPEGKVTLPTEAEWELAARGDSGRLYPWGDEPPTPRHAWWVGALGGAERYRSERTEAERGLVYPEAPAAVGGRPAGASLSCGAEDLAGNVWELCHCVWTEESAELGDTDSLGSGADPTAAPPVLRGGSWFDPADELRCDVRRSAHPGSTYADVGFRVVFRPGPRPPS